MTAVQGRSSPAATNPVCRLARRDYGPGLTRTETVLRPGTDAERHAEYGLDPTASMTPARSQRSHRLGKRRHQ